MRYAVTTLTVKPGTQGEALKRLKDFDFGSGFLACWFYELGALNRIQIISEVADATQAMQQNDPMVRSSNPYGLADLIMESSLDVYRPISEVAAFPDIPPMRGGQLGPIFEVRTYTVKPTGLTPTIELWRNSLPARAKYSPVLAAMYCANGATTRFMHIWPYPSLDERAKLRAKTSADGVWPPAGGPAHYDRMQSDIYLAAPFSPIR